MIIAIEGVSCTGKSTLAVNLAARLGWQIIDCYYHVADDPSVLGEPLATSEAGQLAALAAHLIVERERQHRTQAALERDGAVILDRSVDTLLAHLAAVGRLRGLDAVARAHMMVADSVASGQAAVPDMTLLLTADPAVLAGRAARRPDLPAFYYDPDFAAHFNDYFTNPISPRCLRLDADISPDELTVVALAHLAQAGAIPVCRR